MGLPWWLSSKESACNMGDVGSIPGLGRSLGEGHSNPTPIFLPGESHGQRSLEGHSPWGCKESDMTEHSTQIHSYTRQHLKTKNYLAQNINKAMSRSPDLLEYRNSVYRANEGEPRKYKKFQSTAVIGQKSLCKSWA